LEVAWEVALEVAWEVALEVVEVLVENQYT
jgi:hypothetical protein